MEEPQILARLTNIFRDIFDEGSIEAVPELSVKDIEGWDSLAHIRLILTIEKVFKIKFATSEVREIEKVQDIVSVIKARV